MIRHVTFASNTKGGRIIDPLKVKHCVITALKIYELSGWIDPVTHLNLDFPDHLMKIVYVAEKLEIGAPIVLDGNRFLYVVVDTAAYKHYGEVDVTERSEQLKEKIADHSRKNNL